MEIAYRIVRSNRKTLSLTVDRTGQPVVRAPLRADAELIGTFVQKHIGWIERRRREILSRPTLDLRDGAELTLFGVRYVLCEGRTRTADGRIFLPAEGREAALVRLLKKLSASEMEARTAALAARFGFRYRGVRISSARGRWGSCNRDGVIAYTFRVAFLPTELTEYVAVHELAHTVVFDHSPRFWAQVAAALPDWKTRRAALKKSDVMHFL